MRHIEIGTAGWSLPRDAQPLFAPEGTHLQRYSQTFRVTEINSSFHRSHRSTTYARWAASVPDGFRFSLKLPKQITHKLKLQGVQPWLEAFLAESEGLGAKRAVLLVQLPPKLAYQPDIAGGFWQQLRALYSGGVACEPRHPSWFSPEAERQLLEFQVARVAADPALCPEAALPGGWFGLSYYRLHGSPRMYYSAYSTEWLRELAKGLRGPCWCIFDNTTLGAGTHNALELLQLLQEH